MPLPGLEGCAPGFVARVKLLLADIPDAYVAEGMRTAARQSWLYGFGRAYDDGRGEVTNAQTVLWGWHGFGLAADIWQRGKEWNLTPDFKDKLNDACENHGLAWGGHWKRADNTHVQWADMPTTPQYQHRALAGNLPELWAMVGAV